MNKIAERLLEKSKEALIVGIEIYNKPTIKYRVEGFSFFICNAWELMIKSYLIKRDGEKSIYFKDNPNRTLSLKNCISKVFTNEKDPLRLNLEKIVELRDTSTHFITEEYEMVYVPLFQACILNFNNKMKEFHNFDMATIIPQNFLTLSVNPQELDDSDVLAKYPPEISNKYIKIRDTILGDPQISNNKFAINVKYNYFITKSKDDATLLVRIDNTSEDNVRIIKELKDPNNTHHNSTTDCVNTINDRLKKAKIQLNYGDKETTFNIYHFNLFCKYFNLKESEKYCYHHEIGNRYGYSDKAIDFIVDEIKKDPEGIICKMKETVSKK